jgi:hypothetical protein
MLVYFTVSLAVLLGFVGLAVDVGRMQLATTQLQAVADDAAMTAATEFSNGNTNWQTVATSEATSAGAANSLPSVGASFQFGANTGPYAGNQSVIQATVTQSIPLYFMPLVTHLSTWTASAQAVAQLPPCSFFTGADPNGYSVDLSNMNPLNSSWCPIYVAKVYIDNTSWWNDLWVEATGTAAQSSVSSGAMVTNPIYSQTAISDPLSYLTAPTFSACTAGDTSLNISTTTTLSPGTYCKGLTIANNANVTFNPGLYIITGTFTVGIGGTLTGNGVTFYLTQGGGGSYGNAIIGNASSEVEETIALTAPYHGSGGGTQGILFWVDPAWTGSGAAVQFTNCYWTGTGGIIYSKPAGVTAYYSDMRSAVYFGFDTTYFYDYSTSIHMNNNYSALSTGNPFQLPVVLVQ